MLALWNRDVCCHLLLCRRYEVCSTGASGCWVASMIRKRPRRSHVSMHIK